MKPWMVLIGPAGAGKTTIGEAVAEVTGRPFVDLDAVAAPYYAEVGWSIEKLVRRIEAVGRVAAEREWEPARAHAVSRAVAEHPGAVLALGAGHTSYRDPGCRAAVRAALRDCPDVVLLLPAADPALALDVLRRRCLAGKGRTWISEGHDFLAEWLHDEGTREMATRTAFTEGISPAALARGLSRSSA
ncbi:hypothetical protein JOF41_005981 [Saccharothrix coeruleofusca]|uniref:shikimate kinase n=1 Tax=Saccharothrix coeruleofusca TaxID=33919 RepID=UPI001AEA3D05|nr:shikimate kinase [Saccharothrix coeruleofusca]MBP2339803.1 hypothetical protein [Saccharothrix coeruleofusca]